MTVCEFCKHFQKQECRLGLNLPKTMSCREFAPSLSQFCADPKDFVNSAQIIQMGRFFGFQRVELKKISLMAAGEESLRASLKPEVSDAFNKFSGARGSGND